MIITVSKLLIKLLETEMPDYSEFQNTSALGVGFSLELCLKISTSGLVHLMLSILHASQNHLSKNISGKR